MPRSRSCRWSSGWRAKSGVEGNPIAARGDDGTSPPGNQPGGGSFSTSRVRGPRQEKTETRVLPGQLQAPRNVLISCVNSSGIWSGRNGLSALPCPPPGRPALATFAERRTCDGTAPFRPQHEQRALNLFFEVCLIVRKVDRACRAIIFTNGMDSVGPAKDAQIFLKHGGADPVGQRSVSLFPPSHSKVHFRKYSALFWTMVSGNGDG